MLSTSFDKDIVPLGHLRLRIVEMVHNLIKLNHTDILLSLASSKVIEKISKLMILYPWNNFLQLKAIQIFEEILENENADFRKAALISSLICPTLIQMSKDTNFNHVSNRTIRQGNMATMVKIANSLVKNSSKAEV